MALHTKTNDETVLRTARGVSLTLFRAERLVVETHLSYERVALLLAVSLLICTHLYPTRYGEGDGALTDRVQENLSDRDGSADKASVALMPAPAAVVDYVPRSSPLPVRLRTISEVPTRRVDWQPGELQYVERFVDIALDHEEVYGIPASITLAQGLLESGTGRSELARLSKNHFGIKCWDRHCAPGHCVNHSDDSHKDFFRRFDSPAESYAAHVQVLLKDRYQSCFDLPPSDYRGWARGLSQAGYATDPAYADKLVRLIERLQLYRVGEQGILP